MGVQNIKLYKTTDFRDEKGLAVQLGPGDWWISSEWTPEKPIPKMIEHIEVEDERHEGETFITHRMFGLSKEMCEEKYGKDWREVVVKVPYFKGFFPIEEGEFV